MKKKRSKGSCFAERPLLLVEQNMVLCGSFFFIIKRNVLFIDYFIQSNAILAAICSASFLDFAEAGPIFLSPSKT